MDKIFKIKNKQDGRYISGLYKKSYAPHMLDAPSTCMTLKSMLCQTKGCPYAPYIWVPPYVWMVPVCLDTSISLDAPVCLGAPYVWMPPVCLDTPIGLDAPICLDDVWMPPVHKQYKESMFCQTKGVSICLHTFGCPHMFGWCPVCLDTSMSLDAPVCLGAPMFGYLLYAWTPP